MIAGITELCCLPALTLIFGFHDDIEKVLDVREQN